MSKFIQARVFLLEEMLCEMYVCVFSFKHGRLKASAFSDSNFSNNEFVKGFVWIAVVVFTSDMKKTKCLSRSVAILFFYPKKRFGRLLAMFKFFKTPASRTISSYMWFPITGLNSTNMTLLFTVRRHKFDCGLGGGSTRLVG